MTCRGDRSPDPSSVGRPQTPHHYAWIFDDFKNGWTEIRESSEKEYGYFPVPVKGSYRSSVGADHIRSSLRKSASARLIQHTIRLNSGVFHIPRDRQNREKEPGVNIKTNRLAQLPLPHCRCCRSYSNSVRQ
jgi:hypothetical protein